MDILWFKKMQRQAGVTAEDIAAKMGRDRSIVSKIYSGQQRMSLDWAKAFADVLNVSLDEVLEHAGELDTLRARELKPGFAESDAAPFIGKGGDANAIEARARAFGGGRPGVDVWEVRGGALALGGYMPGDYMLVDTHQSETVRAGDIVIAQRYDGQTGSATTLLRRFEPPVLVAASTDPEDQRVHIVDGANVVIRGKVVASWRG